jgi:hypothetical protein
VLELLAAGKTFQEICSEDYFSDLTREDIAACIEYANKLVANEDKIPSKRTLRYNRFTDYSTIGRNCA